MKNKDHVYGAELTAEITENAVRFQQNVLGLALETWGYEKEEVEKSLLELERYRSIGSIEKCEEAVEIQTPKKPDYEGDGYADGQIVYDTWICPNCGRSYETDYEEYECCPHCGQKIDWSDDNDGE